MYSANPATAQVPFSQHESWLKLLATFAAEKKNQMLVSNVWSQAQFEYQTGIAFPVIRVHGLYAKAKHDGAACRRQSDVLVYDRSGPLLAHALEALRSVL